MLAGFWRISSLTISGVTLLPDGSERAATSGGALRTSTGTGSGFCRESTAEEQEDGPAPPIAGPAAGGLDPAFQLFWAWIAWICSRPARRRKGISWIVTSESSDWPGPP